MSWCAAALAAGSLVAAAPRIQAQVQSLPQSHLAVHTPNGWNTWWASSAAPAAWAAPDPRVARAIAWKAATRGIEYGELELAGQGEAWRTRVIVVRADPARLRFQLDTSFRTPLRANWSLARVPAAAVLAFNTGQFVDAMPWGWVIMDGKQFLPPGSGPLAVAVIGDSSGKIRWLPADSVNPTTGQHASWAFESYPELLRRDSVPVPLRSQGLGVDLTHRDARLAMGLLRDGRLLVVLTRFDGAGPAMGMVPFGLTTPEMAALMGALGCTNAVLLDGGISAQLMVRDSQGRAQEWRALRRVPLALLAFPR